MTVSGRVVAVVNPSSQNGALGRRWPAVQSALARELGRFEHVMTTAPFEAPALTRRALQEGADLVIAVGGDGTIHEVANGFFDERGRPVRPDATLGVVPFGTGGDFRRSFGLPRDLHRAAQAIRDGRRRTIDVGLLEYAEGGRGGARRIRVFVNIASFGVAGLVDRLVNSSSKALGGALSFFLGTTRAVWRYRNLSVRVVFDGDEASALEASVLNVAVANCRYFGGGMHIAPNAVPDDGLFDVVLLGDLTKLELLKDGLSIYEGAHLAHPKVIVRRAARVEASAVRPGDEVLLDVDGEAPGALPASFTIVPRALNLIVPEPDPEASPT